MRVNEEMQFVWPGMWARIFWFKAFMIFGDPPMISRGG